MGRRRPRVSARALIHWAFGLPAQHAAIVRVICPPIATFNAENMDWATIEPDTQAA